MYFTKVLLALASTALLLNLGAVQPIIRAQSFYADLLPLMSGPRTPAQQSPSNSIHVEITGLRNGKGVVVCALFPSADGFPKNDAKALAHAKSPISNGHVVCEFPDAKEGTYAISVFHDENSNGKLDTNFMGIPREGVGASNNAKGHFGPPKFDAASFHFSSGRMELKITITYL